MSPSPLIAFSDSHPFIPFSVKLLNGREIEIRHPEFALTAFAGGGLWLIHDSGHVEGIDGALIISIRSIEPVDPHHLTG